MKLNNDIIELMANENRPPHIRMYQRRLREIQSDKNRKETIRGLIIAAPIIGILVFCAIQIARTFP